MHFRFAGPLWVLYTRESVSYACKYLDDYFHCESGPTSWHGSNIHITSQLADGKNNVSSLLQQCWVSLFYHAPLSHLTKVCHSPASKTRDFEQCGGFTHFSLPILAFIPRAYVVQHSRGHPPGQVCLRRSTSEKFVLLGYKFDRIQLQCNIYPLKGWVAASGCQHL